MTKYHLARNVCSPSVTWCVQSMAHGLPDCSCLLLILFIQTNQKQSKLNLVWPGFSMLWLSHIFFQNLRGIQIILIYQEIFDFTKETVAWPDLLFVNISQVSTWSFLSKLEKIYKCPTSEWSKINLPIPKAKTTNFLSLLTKNVSLNLETYSTINILFCALKNDKGCKQLYYLHWLQLVLTCIYLLLL